MFLTYDAMVFAEESSLTSSKRHRDESSGRGVSRDPSIKSREVVESRSERSADRSRSDSKRESSPKRNEDHRKARELREERELKEREEAIARREKRRKEREEQKALEAPAPSATASSDHVEKSRERDQEADHRPRERDIPRNRDVPRDREKDRRDRDRSRDREIRRRERSRSASHHHHRRHEYSSRSRDRQHERSSSTGHRNTSSRQSQPTIVSSKLEQLKNDWQAELLEDDLLGNTLQTPTDHDVKSDGAKYASTLMKFLSPRLAGSVLYEQLQAVYGTNDYSNIAAASVIAAQQLQEAAPHDSSIINMKNEVVDISPAATEEMIVENVHTSSIIVTEETKHEDPDTLEAAAPEPVLMSLAAAEEEEPPLYLLGLGDGLGEDFDLYGDLSADAGGASEDEHKDAAMAVDESEVPNTITHAIDPKAAMLEPASDILVKEEGVVADQEQEEAATQKLFLLPRDESSVSSSMLLSDLSINRLSLLCQAARGQNPASTLLQEASALKALFH